MLTIIAAINQFNSVKVKRPKIVNFFPEKKKNIYNLPTTRSTSQFKSVKIRELSLRRELSMNTANIKKLACDLNLELIYPEQCNPSNIQELSEKENYSWRTSSHPIVTQYAKL